jgi:AcrR family transcriptional regulator
MAARSERVPLSRPVIIEKAIHLVDREGLDALSMRRLGLELHVEAMSLYNYFRTKAELLDGIHEALLASMPVPPGSADWERGVRALALGFRRVLTAHPRLVPLFASRPAFSPGSMAQVERALALFRRAGFSIDESLSALNVVVAFIVGHALWQFGTLSDTEINYPSYDALSPVEFPQLAASARALATHSMDEEFEFGLDAMMKGLRAQVERSS